VSHEVRTPLSSVIGFASLLAENPDENLTDQNLVYLERIRRNGLHVLGLIEEVLDLSRIRSLDASDGEPIALDAVIDEAVAQAAGNAAAKDMAVLTDVPDDLPPVIAKRQALVQVLINLLGNAVKHSEIGPIVVGVHRNDAGVADRIDVVDNGPGIATADQDEIFTPFWRGDDVDDDGHSTGLGLAIARTLCREMGFELIVESAEGAGSTFSVLLDEKAERPTHPGGCPAA